MSGATQLLKYASLFRIWDPGWRGFSFSDERPSDTSIVEAWTGRFDREGRPIYEQDIFSIHYDWRLGWVRALVERRTGASEFAGRVTGPDGIFHIAAFEFADAYLDGNLHQHPHLLVPAVAQFPDPEPSVAAHWWSEDLRLRRTSLAAQSHRWLGARALSPQPEAAPESHQQTADPSCFLWSPAHRSNRRGPRDVYSAARALL